MYKVMYLAGWFIFWNAPGVTLKAAHKVDCDSRESARALAAMYNRIYS